VAVTSPPYPAREAAKNKKQSLSSRSRQVCHREAVTKSVTAKPPYFLEQPSMRTDFPKKSTDVSVTLGRVIDRATLYIAGGFGDRKEEGRNLCCQVLRSAQFARAVQIQFTPKRARKSTHRELTFRPQAVILAGWDRSSLPDNFSPNRKAETCNWHRDLLDVYNSGDSQTRPSPRTLPVDRVRSLGDRCRMSKKKVIEKVKPLIFIGSSSEAKSIAEAFAVVLKNEASPAVWWLPINFQPMDNTLNSLRNAADIYDFSLFIMTADDVSVVRRKEYGTVRDNVLFELGLFLGVMGHERTFAVLQEGGAKGGVKTPTDLSGITIPRFSNKNQIDLLTSASQAVYMIKGRINDLGRRHNRFDLRRKFIYDEDKRTFILTLASERIEQRRSYIRKHPLILVLRVYDPDKNLDDDPQIIIGKPRLLPDVSAGDLQLSISSPKLPKQLKNGQRIQAQLLLGPEGSEPAQFLTIGEMIDAGCERLDGVAYG
jgi:predicted nucleotide-binding protein